MSFVISKLISGNFSVRDITKGAYFFAATNCTKGIHNTS